MIAIFCNGTHAAVWWDEIGGGHAMEWNPGGKDMSEFRKGREICSRTKEVRSCRIGANGSYRTRRSWKGMQN